MFGQGWALACCLHTSGLYSMLIEAFRLKWLKKKKLFLTGVIMPLICIGRNLLDLYITLDYLLTSTYQLLMHLFTVPQDVDYVFLGSSHQAL